MIVDRKEKIVKKTSTYIGKSFGYLQTYSLIRALKRSKFSRKKEIAILSEFIFIKPEEIRFIIKEL